jgi:hypothetical protein
MIAPNNAVEKRAVMKVGRRGEEERRRRRRRKGEFGSWLDVP